MDGAAAARRFTSLLTMGECWHNNHHAFPGSARLGLQPGEWDPGWWALQALRRIGLVWSPKLPADLPTRPELRMVSALSELTYPASDGADPRCANSYTDNPRARGASAPLPPTSR